MSIETTRWDVQDGLQTPEDCAAFIQAALEEAADDPAFIAIVLGEVARSRGMAQTARDAGMSLPGRPKGEYRSAKHGGCLMSREGLYKSLSVDGNPSFATVLKVLAALGLRMQVATARVG